MTQLTCLALGLLCWTAACLMPFASSNLGAAPASLQAQSASLLYIYASDPIYWPELTGKLLRNNDILLILPDLVYKVWCEVLPEGWPRIDASMPGVIAHQPAPKASITHVELERDLFDTLKNLDNRSEPVKLWCEYFDGANEFRTEVSVKPFAIANTTCDFSPLSGLVAMGSSVTFACKSGSGYPRPEHRCDIVAEDGTMMRSADVTSVAISDEGHAVTRISLPATRETQGARIECFATQQIAYDGRSYREIRVQRVLPYGIPDFIFARESNKTCKLKLSGDYGVSVRCQSEEGLPETEHKCWISTARIPLKSLPLMAEIQGRSTYITKTNFNNSWTYQDGTVICSLTQQAFFGRNFTFRVPAFKQSTKSCKFAKLKAGVQARCRSGVGIPASEHSCAVHLKGSVKSVALNESTAHDSETRSTFFAPRDSLPRGSQIVCAISQKEFLTKTFTYHVPRYFESSKLCTFSLISQGVRAVCEFSAGHPATRTECSYQPSNTTETVSLKPDSAVSNVPKQFYNVSYTVKLPGPEVSHLGGSLACRVYQGILFSQAFHYRVPVYNAPLITTETTLTTKTTPVPDTLSTLIASWTLIWSEESRTSLDSHTPTMAPTFGSTLGTLELAVDTTGGVGDNLRTTSDTRRLSSGTTALPPTRTRAPNLGRAQKATTAMPLNKKNINFSLMPTAILAAPGTTLQPELRTSNQTAVTLSLALLIALVFILLMSLPIHILRRCLRRNRKAATAASLAESQASAATLLSAATPVHRVQLAHLPHQHQLQLASEDALRAVLCDVCNYRGYRVSKRDGIPDIDQYSMFEFGHQVDPTNKRKSLLVDAQIRRELDQSRKEYRFSM